MKSEEKKDYLVSDVDSWIRRANMIRVVWENVAQPFVPAY